MFQFNACVVCGRILISLPKFKLGRATNTKNLFILGHIHIRSNLANKPRDCPGLQKQGKRFFSKALVYLMMMMMMMMMIIIIIIIIIYITFKGDFLSRQYYEMLILFSYISHNQWELIFVTEI